MLSLAPVCSVIALSTSAMGTCERSALIRSPSTRTSRPATTGRVDRAQNNSTNGRAMAASGHDDGPRVREGTMARRDMRGISTNLCTVRSLGQRVEQD